MLYTQYHGYLCCIINIIEGSVVADPDTVEVHLTLDLDAAARSGILAQDPERIQGTLPHLTG